MTRCPLHVLTFPTVRLSSLSVVSCRVVQLRAEQDLHRDTRDHLHDALEHRPPFHVHQAMTAQTSSSCELSVALIAVDKATYVLRPCRRATGLRARESGVMSRSSSITQDIWMTIVGCAAGAVPGYAVRSWILQKRVYVILNTSHLINLVSRGGHVSANLL